MKTEPSGVFILCPLGYWETCGAANGIIGSISGKSIRIRSGVNMPYGAKLRIRIFVALDMISISSRH